MFTRLLRCAVRAFSGFFHSRIGHLNCTVRIAGYEVDFGVVFRPQKWGRILTPKNPCAVSSHCVRALRGCRSRHGLVTLALPNPTSLTEYAHTHACTRVSLPPQPTPTLATHVSKQARAHKHTHTCVRTRTHARTHTHTHSHTHTLCEIPACELAAAVWAGSKWTYHTSD